MLYKFWCFVSATVNGRDELMMWMRFCMVLPTIGDNQHQPMWPGQVRIGHNGHLSIPATSIFWPKNKSRKVCPSKVGVALCCIEGAPNFVVVISPNREHYTDPAWGVMLISGHCEVFTGLGCYKVFTVTRFSEMEKREKIARTRIWAKKIAQKTRNSRQSTIRAETA